MYRCASPLVRCDSPPYHYGVNDPAKGSDTSGSAPGQEPTGGPAADAPLREKVEHILSMIRPAVQSDGGDLELVEVTDEGVVRVRFHGACVGCPSSELTLQVGIERSLKSRIPEVTEVQLVA